MPNYTSAIKNSFNFAISVKRLGFYFLFNLVMLGIIALPTLNLYYAVKAAFGAAIPISSLVPTMIGNLILLFLATVLISLLTLYVNIAFIQNYWASRKKDVSVLQSLKAVKPSYLTALAAAVIIMGITMMFSFVQYIGVLIAMVIGLVFFFIYQDIVISKSNFSAAMSKSVEILKRNFMTILITWTIISIFSLIIMFVSCIPLFATLAMILPFAVIKGGLSAAILAVKQNLVLVVLTSLIAFLGAVLNALFVIGMQTDIYLQIKKKK